MATVNLFGFEEGSPYAGFGALEGAVETSITKDSGKAWKCTGGTQEVSIVDSYTQDCSSWSLMYHFYVVSLPGSGQRFGLKACTQAPTHDEARWVQILDTGHVRHYGGVTFTSTPLQTGKWYVYIGRWTGGTEYFEIRDLSGNVMGTGSVSRGGQDDYIFITHDPTSAKGGSQSAAGGTVIVDNIVMIKNVAAHLVDDATYGCGSEDYFLTHLRVAGNGSQMDWNGGGDYTAVDELPADDDTTYIQQAGGSGNVDSLFSHGGFAASTPRLTKSIHGVCLWLRRDANDAGGGGMASYPLIKSGATKAVGSGSASLSWSWIRGGWTEDPNTSADWTIPAIEAMEIGARAAAAHATVARQSAYSCYVWCEPRAGGIQAVFVM